MTGKSREQEIPFGIFVERDKIVLKGDIDSAHSVIRAACREAFANAPRLSRFVIDAADARIIPEGVTIWIQITEDLLADFELVYAPSQLGMILQYDERYKHPKSFFQEYGFDGDESRHSSGGAKAAD